MQDAGPAQAPPVIPPFYATPPVNGAFAEYAVIQDAFAPAIPDNPAAIHLASSGLVGLDSLVTGRFGLDQVEEALESDQDPSSLKSLVYPWK